MAEDRAERPEAPKTHARLELSRLEGSGVELRDLSGPDSPDRVELLVGDSAAHVALVGDLHTVMGLIVEADRLLTHLHHDRRVPQ